MADEPYDPAKHGQVITPPAAVVAPGSVVRVPKEEPYDPAKHGEVKQNIDEEIADWKRYGITPPTQPDQYGVHDPGASATQEAPPKPKLEYPDAKTVARMPLPPTSAISDKDVYGRPAIPFKSSMALQFGPLMTSDPIARQEIVLKHLPGAVKAQDKYGNPMVEYKGEKYYMSRPGEFDATDASRLAAGVVASAPAALLAPESLVGASLLTGATSGVQSLAEDAATRAAGGEHQQIDLPKAGISTGLGMILPFGVGKMLAPAAGEAAAGLRAPLADAAIEAMGFTKQQIANMSPEIRQAVSDTARKTFGNRQSVQSAYRTGILKEQGIVPGQPGGPTRGEITGDPGQIAREQKLAGPGNADAQATILNNRAAQDANLTLAQQKLRAQVGGGADPTPDQAGARLQELRNTADANAKTNTDVLYKAARDPAAVEAAGGTTAVPATHASQFGRVARDALEGDDIGRTVLGDQAATITPFAKRALASIESFSQKAVGPRVDLSKTTGTTGTVYNPGGLLEGKLPPGTTVTRAAIDQPGTVTKFPDIPWQKAEDLRQVLVGLEEKANAAWNFGKGEGSKKDVAAMAQLRKQFDDHFGPLNPLYEPARAANAERMSIFKPGGSSDTDKLTNQVLTALDSNEPGAAILKTIFNPSKIANGEAVQMLDHLNNGVFATQPEARDIIKQQALRRLQFNAKNDPLTPQEQATALHRALDNDAEAPVYQRLFSGPELAVLRRQHEAMSMLGASRKPINPPSSGLLTIATLKSLAKPVLGGGAGYLTGIPGMETAGAAAGFALDKYLPPFQASRAVRPPANYGMTPNVGQPAMVGGLLANQGMQTPQQGPADRIMGLLTTGQGL